MALSFMAFPATIAGNALTYALALFTGPTLAVYRDTTSAVDTTIDTTVDTAVDTALAHITTDTGDFAPGRTTFSRYNTPQFCLGAVQNARWVARRDVASQLADGKLQQTPLRDTLPTVAVDVARACATTFSVTTTPPRDLPDLAQLALAANQDSMAVHVVTRQLSLVSNARARDSVLTAAMELYLTAEPARLAAATALVDRVAEPGDAGRRWQLGALTRLLTFSEQAWDTSSTTRFATQIVDTVTATPAAHRARLAWIVMKAYKALAAQAYLHSPDSLRGIAQRARQTWHDFATPLDTMDKKAMAWDSTRSAPVEDYVQRLSPVSGMGESTGAAYPALQASYWFPGPPPADSPRLILSTEVPGVLHGGCLTGELELLYDPARWCLPFYERIRSLATQYGSRLQIVLVAVTHGTTIRSLPMSPKEEAERLKWYLLDYLKLPVTLAVIERPVGSLPAPDRRQWRPSVCDRNDPDADMSVAACKYLRPDAVLLDRNGTSIPLWGPEAHQDLIIEQQVSGTQVSQ
jgi:hypothetical protein